MKRKNLFSGRMLPEYSKMRSNSEVNRLMSNDLERSYDLTSKLINYKGKCFIIMPMQDVISPQSAYKIKELIPQTEIFTIDKAGHFPDLEQPAILFKILRHVLNN